MDALLTVIAGATAIFFIWRALFGPQRKFATLFLVLTLLGCIGVLFAPKGGVVFLLLGTLLVLAPLVGIVMLVYSILDVLQNNKQNPLK